MKKIMIVLPLLIGIGSVSMGSIAGEPEIGQEIVLAIDLGDLTDQSPSIIREEVNNLISQSLENLPAELTCSVTVKGKVSIGVATVEIIVEVSGPCDEVRKQGTAIANQVLNDVKNALKN